MVNKSLRNIIIPIFLLFLTFHVQKVRAGDDIKSIGGTIPKVIVHPEMDDKYVLKMITEARNFIAFSALSIPSKDFAIKVVEAHKRGVKVYIIITNPFFEVGVGYPEMSKKFETDIVTLKNMKDRLQRDIEYLNILTDNNIYPHYIDRKYYINHLKLLIIDNIAFISTSPKCEKRDFSITLSEKDQLDALKAFFFHDYEQEHYNSDRLEKLGFVIGPENQREHFENLIKTAKKSIHIYAADFNDKSICKIIEDALKRSIKIYVISTPNFFGFNEQSLNTQFYLKRIKQFGAEIKIVRQPFIHAKIIMIDIDDPQNKAMYFGSCNIFSNSIDHTRELGLIVRSDDYINPILTTFLKDWERGADF